MNSRLSPLKHTSPAVWCVTANSHKVGAIPALSPSYSFVNCLHLCGSTAGFKDPVLSLISVFRYGSWCALAVRVRAAVTMIEQNTCATRVQSPGVLTGSIDIRNVGLNTERKPECHSLSVAKRLSRLLRT